MTPFDALGNVFLGWLRDKILQKWLSLIFELCWSGILSFLFVCGSALVAKTSPAISIGAGMVMSAITMTVVFRRSPLTRGLLLVLPSAEAAKEMEADLQVIQRP